MEAADQMVSLSLKVISELVEKGLGAVQLSGSLAYSFANWLVEVYKEHKEIAGKDLLDDMLKTGEPLSLFAIPTEDLEKFVKGASQYHVDYVVVEDLDGKDETTEILCFTAQERIIDHVVEKYGLNTVEKLDLSVNPATETPERSEKPEPERDVQLSEPGATFASQFLSKAKMPELSAPATTNENPTMGTERNSLSVSSLDGKDSKTDFDNGRESVIEKLHEYSSEIKSKQPMPQLEKQTKAISEVRE